ncbi:hypothetical protein ABZX40_13430 [Streptomyces sp. NPDC004610]|uniref:hypothetical protein n=1 Tax=unclassified Streptomyces TaxID=2593676 RepID=UPI0033BC3216
MTTQPPGPAEELDRTPRPNPILDRPATVEQAQQDYADAADIRQRLGWGNR